MEDLLGSWILSILFFDHLPDKNVKRYANNIIAIAISPLHDLERLKYLNLSRSYMIMPSACYSNLADGEAYHKSCFRCSHGRCVISSSNYITHEHRLYCRPHHSQLFKQKGNFSQLDSHYFLNGITKDTKHSFCFVDASPE
ncbi:hypothetical protein Droror1_Dr00000429 [Drosera rotundifolia]